MDSDGYLPEILTLLRQLLPLLISLLDDAFALVLTRLGCHLPWLEDHAFCPQWSDALCDYSWR